MCTPYYTSRGSIGSTEDLVAATDAEHQPRSLVESVESSRGRTAELCFSIRIPEGGELVTTELLRHVPAGRAVPFKRGGQMFEARGLDAAGQLLRLFGYRVVGEFARYEQYEDALKLHQQMVKIERKLKPSEKPGQPVDRPRAEIQLEMRQQVTKAGKRSTKLVGGQLRPDF